MGARIKPLSPKYHTRLLRGIPWDMQPKEIFIHLWEVDAKMWNLCSPLGLMPILPSPRPISCITQRSVPGRSSFYMVTFSNTAMSFLWIYPCRLHLSHNGFLCPSESHDISQAIPSPFPPLLKHSRQIHTA
ncbi:ADM_HP2_G0024840.mRNA.1.CDS.1 [Saccharomyces cerevisiae]|nr:ADM_HP2_G0024840.mRNA.1.CDS.1 [Saccharomyces cerevisiae]CAI6450805.1 ADM_HP2_G0024840.mRNA.1.CDS.1 [Saccharomyces cerevisiae]